MMTLVLQIEQVQARSEDQSGCLYWAHFASRSLAKYYGMEQGVMSDTPGEAIAVLVEDLDYMEQLRDYDD